MDNRKKVRKKRKNNITNFEKEEVQEIIINKGKVDPIILISLIVLVSFGVIMVFSASYYVGKVESNDIFYYFKRQAVFALLGFMILPMIIKIDWKVYKKFSKMAYVIANILLLLVLVIGVERYGAKRWLELGPLRFQPSEIAKICVILYLSKYIADNKKILNTWRGFWKCFLILAIPGGLILLEKALSTTIILIGSALAIIFVATPTIKYFLPLGVLGISGLAGIFMFGGVFRMQRIVAWLDPFADGIKGDKGFQIVQSLYAIASGGLFGLGIGQSRQKLGYMPMAQNDIIYSIICEELGLVGASIFILLFIMIIWRGYITAMNVPHTFMTYACVGITTMIALQVVINVGVVTNTIPNTGIPLPFVSYGGTSLIIMIASVGVILNFSRYFKN